MASIELKTRDFTRSRLMKVYLRAGGILDVLSASTHVLISSNTAFFRCVVASLPVEFFFLELCSLRSSSMVSFINLI